MARYKLKTNEESENLHQSQCYSGRLNQKWTSCYQSGVLNYFQERKR